MKINLPSSEESEKRQRTCKTWIIAISACLISPSVLGKIASDTPANHGATLRGAKNFDKEVIKLGQIVDGLIGVHLSGLGWMYDVLM